MPGGGNPNKAGLSDEQIKEFKDVFALFDKEGSGEIATEQLETVMTSLGMNPTKEELDEMIEEADEDGSGTIDFDEFVGLMAKRMQCADSDEEFIQVFQIFANGTQGCGGSGGSGGGPDRPYITHSSLRAVMAGLGEVLTEEEVDEMFREAVGDMDRISLDDFLKLKNKVLET